MREAEYAFVFYICLHLFLAVAVYRVRQDAVTKRWARYFSGGLIILAAQSALRWYDLANGNVPFGRFQTLLSVLNNPFFLAGALTLLDRNSQNSGWRHILSSPLFLTVLAATVCIAVGLLLWGTPLPSLFIYGAAAISVMVYVIEAYAYFTVLDFFRYNALRFLPIITALFFSSYELVVVFAPAWGAPSYISLMFRLMSYIPPVLMLTLHMPQDLELKKSFEKATQKREFILSGKMVESVGKLIKAQKVMFLIKKPDFHLGAREPLWGKFDGYAWEMGRAEDKGDDSLEAALKDTTEAEQELLWAVCPRGPVEGARHHPHQYCRSAKGFETIILPIEIYGGVIGALFVRLHTGVRVRAIFVEKLKLALLILLPLAQGSRQMAAVRMLSEGFTGNQFLSGREGEGGKLEVIEGVDEILGSILDTLSPLAVALRPSAHFKPGGRVLLRPDAKYFPHELRDDFVTKYFSAEPDDKPLNGIRPFRVETDFGRLIMFVCEESDHPDLPTMGIHPVVVDVLRTMTNGALKSILDHNLSRILEAADKELSEGMTQTSDAHQVVRMLKKYARRFGIRWVVVVLDGHRFYGQEEEFELVRPRLRDCEPDGKIKVEELGAEDKRGGWLVSSGCLLESSARGNGHLASQISFWFGGDDPDFRRDETWDNIFRQFIRLGVSKIKDLRMRDLLERWDDEQEVRLQELARFCRYVGNEARLITFGVKEEAGLSNRSVHFRRLKLLTDELNEVADFLSRLGPAGAAQSERLVLEDVIQEAWESLNASGQGRGGALLFEGDCRAQIMASKDELRFLFSRLLHWLVSSAEEGGRASSSLTARCRLHGLEVEISLESDGFRMHRMLRESMFVPMTQPINDNQPLKDSYPKRFLAMYLAKTILEKWYKGQLADRSDELPGEAGHKLVVTMPVLN